MAKRILMLAGFLGLALLTNLSFRIPTGVQAQANCVTASAPAFTLGTQKNLPLPGGGVLTDGDLFYLGNNNGVQFTTSDPNTFLQTILNEANQVPFGYPNTINLRFQNQTANTTVTALSCNDSFWDINFALYGGGPNAAGVAGDVFEIFLIQPDGSSRINLATFTTTADGNATTVTGLLSGADLSAVGHTPTTVGRVIPFELPGGTDGNGNAQFRTNLITLALPMNGTIPNCAQLGITIRKAGGNGRSMIVLANLVVTRTATTTATGTGLQSGLVGTYPTGLACTVACPACAVTTPVACDRTLCFYDACVWCQQLQFFPARFQNFMVQLPNQNFGQPINVFVPFVGGGRIAIGGIDIDQRVLLALGCGGFFRPDVTSMLTAEYVATQLSLQQQIAFYFTQVGRQQIGCQLAVGAPLATTALTLSNGTIISTTSTFQDLFNATNSALQRGNLADQAALLAIYKQLRQCAR